MSFGSHAYIPDPRNASVFFNVNGELLPRDKAVVNVFDSGFMLGDGIWEGLRVHQGKIAFLEDCLLYTSPSPRDQRGSRMPSSA